MQIPNPILPEDRNRLGLEAVTRPGLSRVVILIGPNGGGKPRLLRLVHRQLPEKSV